jgi:hypothetical protein
MAWPHQDVAFLVGAYLKKLIGNLSITLIERKRLHWNIFFKIRFLKKAPPTAQLFDDSTTKKLNDALGGKEW